MSEDRPRRRKRYTYQPLTDPRSEIRLLQFLPSDHSDLIYCTLKTVSLNDHPTFLAGSYEWGDPIDVDIKIDGQTSQIRHNLWLFLRWLTTDRSELIHSAAGSGFFLWVDALCIDQENLAEKACQVQMMGQIFHQAELVYAWLGWSSTFDSKRTIQFITEASSVLATAKAKGSRDGIDYETALDNIPSRFRERTFEKLPLEQLWQSVIRMLELSYWSRRWIIQEIILAKKVILLCDGHELPWLTLQSLLQNFEYRVYGSGVNTSEATKVSTDYLDRMVYTVPGKMSRHRELEQKSGSHYFIALLNDFQGTECESVRDKVFSFLHLFEQGSLIGVDYTCSLTTLYCNIVIALGAFPKLFDSQSNFVRTLSRELGLLDLHKRAASVLDSGELEIDYIVTEQNPVEYINFDSCVVKLKRVTRVYETAKSFYQDAGESRAYGRARDRTYTGNRERYKRDVASMLSEAEKYDRFKMSRMTVNDWDVEANKSLLTGTTRSLSELRATPQQERLVILECEDGTRAATSRQGFPDVPVNEPSALVLCHVADGIHMDIGFILETPTYEQRGLLLPRDPLLPTEGLTFRVLGLAINLEQNIRTSAMFLSRRVSIPTVTARLSLESADCLKMIKILEIFSDRKFAIKKTGPKEIKAL